jgi:hypothetical protein
MVNKKYNIKKDIGYVIVLNHLSYIRYATFILLLLFIND